MKAELKSVKIHERLSEETTCFSAMLYVEGQRCAEITNRGCGGCDDVHAFNQPLLAQFEAWVKTLPDRISDYDSGPPSRLKMDLELYVGELLDQWRIRKWSKKNTVFTLKGEPSGLYHMLKQPYSYLAYQYIIGEYGKKINVIYNERGVEV